MFYNSNSEYEELRLLMQAHTSGFQELSEQASILVKARLRTFEGRVYDQEKLSKEWEERVAAMRSSVMYIPEKQPEFKRGFFRRRS